MRLLTLPLAAVAAVASCGASAETAAADAAVFGARESVLDVSLSPSGNRLALIAPGGPSTEVLYVAGLAGGDVPKPILVAKEPDSELERCDWATEERLVCQIYIVQPGPLVIAGFTRLFSVGADGKGIVILSKRAGRTAYGLLQDGGDVVALDPAGKPGDILMTHQWLAEFSTGTHVANTDEGLGVDEVDVTTGKAHKLEPADADAVRYIADENGRVRLRVHQHTDSNGYLEAERTFSYRPADSDRWQPLSQVGGENDADFVPVAVSAVDNAVYGFETIDGFQAVVSLALDGSGTRKVVLARNDVDVDELIRIGRQRRVVGASYATEKRSVAYFDKDLAALSAKLQKALPGKPLVDIVDASADEKTLLLIASSDTDPGEVYLFDRDSYELSPLFPLRSQLAGRTMGEMKPVTFPAADGTQIPGYLTLPPGSDGKNLPAIVMPHGGPGARDEWGFDWLVQYLVARGYAVLQPNFRGSSGYGEDWFGHNGFQAWRTAIGDVDDAGRWMVRQGIADPAKLAIVGWSYGGYAALQSQVVDPDLFKAVVAIAPVTDLGTLRGENRDYTNFRLVRDFVGDGPQIDDGSPARHAQAFKAPVLLFHGTLDQNVSVEHSRLMKQRLEDAGKTVEYTEFDGTDHYIEDSDMRTKMLVEIDQFLGQSLKR